MTATVYILDPDPARQHRMGRELGLAGHTCVFVDSAAALFAPPPTTGPSCLVVSVEPDAAATLALVRQLRTRGVAIPVIAIGRHSAFRTAIDIARLESTDFLELPVGARALLAAVAKACHESEGGEA